MSPSEPHMEDVEPTKNARSQTSRLTISAIVVAIVLILGFTIPSPYAIERPGPVVNTLGSISLDGEDTSVIEITGTETFETSGSLNLLTVSTLGSPSKPLGWFALLPALFDHTQQLRPLDELFRDGRTPEEREKANRILMEQSQAAATAAALNLLDVAYEATIQVESVLEDTPADGAFEAGDVIIAIDGVPIAGASAIRSQIAAHEPGVPVTFEVRRSGATEVVTVTPERVPGQQHAFVGIMMTSEYEFPLEVEIVLDRIGGPSAGLIFSLGIYDELTPGKLTGGLDVSGTGTVDEAGNVGAIGGLPQKIWGAARAESDLFLMPLANCHDLPQETPENMVIAPVATTTEALNAIEAVGAGKEPAGIERCDSGIAQGFSIQ